MVLGYPNWRVPVRPTPMELRKVGAGYLVDPPPPQHPRVPPPTLTWHWVPVYPGGQRQR